MQYFNIHDTYNCLFITIIVECTLRRGLLWHMLGCVCKCQFMMPYDKARDFEECTCYFCCCYLIPSTEVVINLSNSCYLYILILLKAKWVYNNDQWWFYIYEDRFNKTGEIQMFGLVCYVLMVCAILLSHVLWVRLFVIWYE